MKHAKILGLMAVVAAAVTAFASAASASQLTSPENTIYTSTIKATSEGATSLDGAFTTVTCNTSTVEGKVEKHGSGVTTGGNISTLTFGSCNFPVTVLKKGSLELHAITEVVTPDHTVHHLTCPDTKKTCTATVTGSDSELTIATSVGSCIFTTASTSLGVLTPTNDTTKTATLDINSSKIPRTGGNFLCGSSGTWTGSYVVNTPDSLWVDG